MLHQISPDRRIETAILWTRGPVLMPVDPDIVRQAFAMFCGVSAQPCSR